MGVDVYSYVLKNNTFIDMCTLPLPWEEIYGPEPEKDTLTVGYLRESYWGGGHPTKTFIPESYDRDAYVADPATAGEEYPTSYWPVSVALLESRIEATEKAAMERCRYLWPDESDENFRSSWSVTQYRQLLRAHKMCVAGDLPTFLVNSY